MANPAAQLLKADPVKLAMGAAIVRGVVYLLGRQTVKDVGRAAGAAASAVANINEGTPYDGAGVVGTLGNAANALSGGLLARLGGWIGRGLYDVTHKEPR